MTNSNGDKSFWKMFGGIVTGVTGIVSAVVTILALLVPGGEPDARPRTPKGDEAIAAWAKRANEICKDVASDITALGGTETPDQVAAGLPRARSANDELATVPRPPDARDRIARMIALYGESYDQLDAAITATALSDDQAVRAAVSAAVETTARADALATELGADSCRESPAPTPRAEGA